MHVSIVHTHHHLRELFNIFLEELHIMSHGGVITNQSIMRLNHTTRLVAIASVLLVLVVRERHQERVLTLTHYTIMVWRQVLLDSFKHLHVGLCIAKMRTLLSWNRLKWINHFSLRVLQILCTLDKLTSTHTIICHHVLFLFPRLLLLLLIEQCLPLNLKAIEKLELLKVPQEIVHLILLKQVDSDVDEAWSH